ncbi:MAG: peptidylprolyl isomerase [Microscillaceae bacterium]|nr:peptidylprolyl isomerase [Microscillaceae bacterium]MDW8460881.1 peptidylprolyl isomerase [Cytophagales bacterium]
MKHYFCQVLTNAVLTIYIYLGVTILFSSTTQAQGGLLLDKIVAKVDNYIILKSELDYAYFNAINGQNPQPPGRKTLCQILEGLIINKLLLAKAEIDSVVVKEKQVTDELNRRMEYMIKTTGGDAKRIEEAFGKSIEVLKEELRTQVKEQLIMREMENKITADVKITPKEVRKFFNSIPKDSIPYLGTEVEVAQIVKLPIINREQKQALKDKLEKIRQRILKGEDFATLAKQYSEDFVTAKDGGDLGWQERGNLVPEFEAAVFRMKPGEVSQVIESQFGFHIIKLIERRGNQYRSSHILMRPNYDLADLSQAEKYLDSLRTKILQDSIKFEKAAKEFSDDKATAQNLGYFMSPSGGRKLFTDEIDFYLYSVIDTMKVGTISKPVPYRTDDGKQAMRIIYFKSKTPPHPASLETDYPKIYTYALNDKKNKAIMQWFKRTRNEVYIRLEPEYKDCKLTELQID